MVLPPGFELEVTPTSYAETKLLPTTLPSGFELEAMPTSYAEPTVNLPTGFEIEVEPLPIGGFFPEFGKGVVRGALNVGAATIGTLKAATELHRKIPTWNILYKGIEKLTGETFEEQQTEIKERIKLASERFPVTHSGGSSWAGRVIGEAIPYMGAALVGGYAIGPAGAAMVGFSVEGDMAYDAAIAKGASEKEAQTERVIVGSINAAIEALQISRLMKFHKTGRHSIRNFTRLVRSKAWKLAGKEAVGFSGGVLRTAIAEAAEEFAQEGVSISVPAILRDDYPKKPDGSIDLIAIGERLGESALGGFVAGGVLGGAGAMMAATPGVAAPTKVEMESAIKRVQESKLSRDEKKAVIRDIKRIAEEGIDDFDTPIYYHGSPVSGLTEIKPTTGDYGVGVYFTSDTKIAEWYSRGRKEAGAYVLGDLEVLSPIGSVYPVTPTLNNPLTITEENFENLENEAYDKGFGGDYKGIANLARQQDYDGIINEINNEHIQFTNKSIKIGLPIVEPDELAIKLNAAIKETEVYRPGEEAEISKERAKRFSEYEEILKDEPNPILASHIAKGALAGTLKIEISPVNLSDTDVSSMYERVRQSTLNSGQKLDVFEGLEKLAFRHQIPSRHEIESMGKVFGKDIVSILMKKRKVAGKAGWDKVVAGINLPRAILASYDLSAPGRQGILLFPMAPKQWLRSVGQGYRAFASPEYADYIDLQIKTDPYYKQAMKAKLDLTEIGGMWSTEEIFMSDFSHKIPGIPASERAYVTTLNSLRFHTFKHFVQKWQGTGRSVQDYKLLAGFINHATGRGHVKKLKKYYPILNATFFAPRLQMGRVQAITDLIPTMEEIRTGKISPVRKLIAADLASFVGGGVLILTLLNMLRGVDVEHDPRSSDFGKIRIGNTRIDFWGGYQPLARYTTQLLAGQAKTAETKRVIDVERGEVVWRFIQSKLSPPAGLAVDLIRGENFIGEKLEPTVSGISEQALQRFVPLFIQDVIDATRFQGLDTAAIVAPLALHGVGTMTYPIRASSESARLKDVYSQEAFGQKWDELGPEFQKALREYRPQIDLLEDKARSERDNYDFMARMAEEQRKAANRVTKLLHKDIKKELLNLSVDVPGLSRHISSDWYLNDKRYKQYQLNTAKVLNAILPKFIKSPNWNNFDFETRREILKSIIDKTKKIVRDNIIQKANVNDLTEITQ